jgi:hypothetical protein
LKKHKKDLKLRISFYILLASFVLLFIQFVVLNFPVYTKEVIINYDNLNEQEKQIASEIIKDLKFEYLQTAKSITFTKDKEKVKIGKKYAWGKNFNREILVLYTGDKKFDADTTCHELIHNLIKTYDYEFFAQDLAKEMICFKNYSKWK